MVGRRSHDREVAGSIPGEGTSLNISYWSSPSERFVAAPWNPRLISVEIGIIIVPNCFVQGCTMDIAVYKKLTLLLLSLLQKPE